LSIVARMLAQRASIIIVTTIITPTAIITTVLYYSADCVKKWRLIR
jgi:hypothetical protein